MTIIASILLLQNSIFQCMKWQTLGFYRINNQAEVIMLDTTLEIVRSGLKSDPTLTPQDRARLLATLRAPAVQKSETIMSAEPRLARRAEVARRLSCSLRTVDKLAASGVLTKRKLPGRVRASGFLASDVDRLIAECGNPAKYE
jgi:hypothetical protein